MMTNQTLDKLYNLNLKAMAEAISEQLSNPEIASLSFDERLGLAVDRECDARASRSLARKLEHASVEDIDFRAHRGLDKTYLACALANKACRLNFTARYFRTSNLLSEIAIARGDGSYPSLMRRLLRNLSVLGRIAPNLGRFLYETTARRAVARSKRPIFLFSMIGDSSASTPRPLGTSSNSSRTGVTVDRW